MRREAKIFPLRAQQKRPVGTEGLVGYQALWVDTPDISSENRQVLQIVVGE